MPIGITKGLTTWRFQDHYVERLMDNATYTAAHPDTTLVLAGPARSDIARTSDVSGTSVSSLLAIGMLQAFSVSQSKPTTPVMAIGSGRSFFVSGKAQGAGQISRLFVNGRNLLRVLHHNAKTQNLRWDLFDDPAAQSPNSMFLTNLDSELYLVPFGLASLFRTKLHDPVGGVYAELTLINSYQIGFTAGSTMVAESVSFLFDRLMPFSANDVALGQVPRATVDAVLGFYDSTSTDAETENLSNATVTSTV